MMREFGLPGISNVNKNNKAEYENLAIAVKKMSIGDLKNELRNLGEPATGITKSNKGSFYLRLLDIKKKLVKPRATRKAKSKEIVEKQPARTLPRARKTGPSVEEKKKMKPSEILAERKERLAPPSNIDVAALAETIKKKLSPYTSRIEIAGSIRRKKLNPTDIDIVAIPKDFDKLKAAIRSLGEWEQGGEHRYTIRVQGVKTEINFSTPESWGAMMLRFTGPPGGNIGLSSKAKNHKPRPWKLNQYGLFDENGKMIAGKTEESIYAAFGMPYKPPELRGKGK